MSDGWQHIGIIVLHADDLPGRHPAHHAIREKPQADVGLHREILDLLGLGLPWKRRQPGRDSGARTR
jgi:hypothetical protein